jgi:integrase
MSTAKRGHGDGTIYWDEKRQRWIGGASLGYHADGRRNRPKISGRTKAEAKSKLKALIRDYEDGLAIAPTDYTVKDAVTDWLAYGLNGRDEQTYKTNKSHCDTHIVPSLGARKLRDLSATEVEKWLAVKAETLSTRSLQGIHSALNRSVRRAMARDKVKRNVVELCSIPTGQVGRPSKSLTFPQAEAVLEAAERSRLYAYVVVSMLTGARTEELRALTWDEVDLEGKPNAAPPVPPHVGVWRSVRKSGDTKTKKSRRTLALPDRCIDALTIQRMNQEYERELAGGRWKDHGLVFASKVGTPLDPAHVRRDFRAAIKGIPGLDPMDWTPREMRHSFVSLLSDNGTTLDEVSQLVGHSSTQVTELVYRFQLRPVLQHGAVKMNDIFA